MGSDRLKVLFVKVLSSQGLTSDEINHLVSATAGEPLRWLEIAVSKLGVENAEDQRQLLLYAGDKLENHELTLRLLASKDVDLPKVMIILRSVNSSQPKLELAHTLLDNEIPSAEVASILLIVGNRGDRLDNVLDQLQSKGLNGKEIILSLIPADTVWMQVDGARKPLSYLNYLEAFSDLFPKMDAGESITIGTFDILETTIQKFERPVEHAPMSESEISELIAFFNHNPESSVPTNSTGLPDSVVHGLSDFAAYMPDSKPVVYTQNDTQLFSPHLPKGVIPAAIHTGEPISLEIPPTLTNELIKAGRPVDIVNVSNGLATTARVWQRRPKP